MAFGYGVKARDTRGLDPKKFIVTIAARRADGEELTAEELEEIKAALLPEAANPEKHVPARKATGGPPAG